MSLPRVAVNAYALPLGPGTLGLIDRSRSPAHKGKLEHAVDFACPEGTPIYAALEGEVAFVRQDSNVGGLDKKRFWNLGNRLVIRHANGEYTAYEHFRYHGALVRVGQRVRTGQRIAYSGNTGYTHGPHLHFEVYRYTGPDKDNDYETLAVKFPGEP